MKWGLLFVLALCCAVLLPGLGAVGALDTREATDLEVSREAVQFRDLLTPLYAFHPRADKPLLAYVPDMLLVRHAYPRSVPLSRAWRAALAMALVLLTAALGARHLGVRAGICAAATLATTLALPLSARADGTQVLATLLAWVAVAGFADAWFGRSRGRDASLLVAYMALASALVIAGPLPALWPFLAAALYLGLTRRPGGWRALRPWAGALILFGLGLPWYGAILERHGFPFFAHVPFFPYAANAHGAWYLGPFLAVSFVVVGLFPWSALLPGALIHAGMWWRPARAPIPGAAPDLAPLARELGHEHAAHWFIACGVASLVPIAFYPSPPLTAVLPALPAAALLCGRLLDHLIEDQSRVSEPVLRATQMLSLTGTVAALLLVLLAGRIPDAARALQLLAAVLFATSWLPFLASLAGRHRLAALFMVLPVALGAPITATRLLPAMEGLLSTHALTVAARDSMPPWAPLVIFEEPPASLRFEFAHNLVRAEWLGGDLARVRAADGRVYVAYRPALEREVATRLGLPAAPPLEVLARIPGLVLARSAPAAPTEP